MDDNDLKETASKQTTVSQNQGNELKNLEKCLQDVKKENSKSKEKIAALEGDLRKVIQEKEELLTRFERSSEIKWKEVHLERSMFKMNAIFLKRKTNMVYKENENH